MIYQVDIPNKNYRRSVFWIRASNRQKLKKPKNQNGVTHAKLLYDLTKEITIRVTMDCPKEAKFIWHEVPFVKLFHIKSHLNIKQSLIFLLLCLTSQPGIVTLQWPSCFGLCLLSSAFSAWKTNVQPGLGVPYHLSSEKLKKDQQLETLWVTRALTLMGQIGVRASGPCDAFTHMDLDLLSFQSSPGQWPFFFPCQWLQKNLGHVCTLRSDLHSWFVCFSMTHFTCSSQYF